jgi:hypothetical protein
MNKINSTKVLFEKEFVTFARRAKFENTWKKKQKRVVTPQPQKKRFNCVLFARSVRQNIINPTTSCFFFAIVCVLLIATPQQPTKSYQK